MMLSYGCLQEVITVIFCTSNFTSFDKKYYHNIALMHWHL